MKDKSTVACPWYAMADLMRLFNVTDRTVWKWIAKGQLPEPVRKSRKWVRWPRHVVDALIQSWGGQVEKEVPCSRS